MSSALADEGNANEFRGSLLPVTRRALLFELTSRFRTIWRETLQILFHVNPLGDKGEGINSVFPFQKDKPTTSIHLKDFLVEKCADP